MDEIAVGDRNPRDPRVALRTAIAVARRYGYRIDDEARSLAGLAVAIALKKNPKDCTVTTYATGIYLRAIRRLKRWTGESFDEHSFIPRKVGTDKAQQLLMQFEEPVRSICHAVWIERRPKGEVAAKHDMSLQDVNNMLDYYAVQLKLSLQDEL